MYCINGERDGNQLDLGVLWCFPVIFKPQRNLQGFPVAGVPAFFASFGLSASFFSSSLSLSSFFSFVLVNCDTCDTVARLQNMNWHSPCPLPCSQRSYELSKLIEPNIHTCRHARVVGGEKTFHYIYIYFINYFMLGCTHVDIHSKWKGPQSQCQTRVISELLVVLQVVLVHLQSYRASLR